MRENSWPSIRSRLRPLLLAAFIFSGIALPDEISRMILQGTAAAGEVERKALGAAKVNYGWNLMDEALPLINLPEHITGGLDLSLTYSLDQFQFPLFQSLYYNPRAGKFILMVFPKEGRNQSVSQAGRGNRRTEFIDLDPVPGVAQLAVNRRLGLRLTDRGPVKVLSTSEGTVYTFSALADGELHCTQIKDRNGAVITLSYTGDSSIQAISDSRGRRVNFSYTNRYLDAITQSWRVNAAELKRTWVIEHEAHHAHRSTAAAGVVTGKRVPSNAIKPTYSATMATSDVTLAAIFGGPGAIAAANGFEPSRLGRQYPLYRGDLRGDDGRMLRGHLSFAMHLYGSEDGTRETALYVPAGFTAHSGGPSPTDAVVTFYYPRLGNLTDVTLAVFHVSNFQLTPEQDRIRVGNIGGPGGSISYYKHSHLEFYRGDTGLPRSSARPQLRIDPATVFTSTLAARRQRSFRSGED